MNTYTILGDVTVIDLNDGKHALIDTEDLPLCLGFNWCAVKDHRRDKHYVQACHKQKTFYLHREVLAHQLTDETPFVDHRNVQPLDNRKRNLRACTQAQNLQNMVRPGASKYPGVHFVMRDNRWQARLRVGGKRLHLGYFKTAEEAHEFRVAKIRELGDEFSNTRVRY